MRRIRELVGDKRGGTLIEYGLICSLIILAIMASLHVFADSVIRMFTHVQNEVGNSTNGL